VEFHRVAGPRHARRRAGRPQRSEDRTGPASAPAEGRLEPVQKLLTRTRPDNPARPRTDKAAGPSGRREQVERWLASRNDEESTGVRDASLMRNHVLPRWGDLPIGKVDHLAVQTWVSELAKRYARATVRECHRLFAAVMKSAVRGRLIPASPCDGIRLPPKRKNRKNAGTGRRITISQEDVADRLLPVVPARYRALVATAGFAGLRWGEAAGLRWPNIDLRAGLLTVAEVVVEVSGRVSRRPYPKSEAGTRLVPIPPALAYELEQHQAAYRTGPDGLVSRTQPAGCFGERASARAFGSLPFVQLGYRSSCGSTIMPTRSLCRPRPAHPCGVRVSACSGRHNQRPSRNASSESGGRYRPVFAASGWARSIACCLWVMSACR
jgi:integrase